jgi:hypothetical protein
MIFGFALGPWEIMIALVLGVLIFGRGWPFGGPRSPFRPAI